MLVRVGLLHDEVGRLVLHGLVGLEDPARLLGAPGQHQGQLGQDADAHQLLQGVVGLLERKIKRLLLC